MDISQILRSAVEKQASDVHLKVNEKPVFRIHRELVVQEDFADLRQEDITRIVENIMPPNLKHTYAEKHEVDFAFLSESSGRFRINIFSQRGCPGIVMRRIKEIIPSFRELNLPDVFKTIAMVDRGIVLITGASSSGKSTTLASIIDYINTHKNRHIMTLENPIEYLHRDKESVVNQREIGVDTESFHDALRHIIRQDPDVIVVGEMRDRESVTASISAAETGHLVLSSFHAENTIQAITRLLDFFPANEKEQIRMQLSVNLKALSCQRLVRTASADKAARIPLVPATEILIVTPLVSKIIRDNEMKKIEKVLQVGEDGMQSFNMSLVRLFKNKTISKEEALSKSSNPEALKINLKGIYLDEDRGIIG